MFGKTLATAAHSSRPGPTWPTEIDAARLQTYRAAWLRDRGGLVTKEVAMAKMRLPSRRNARSIMPCRLFGGRGVVHGAIAERLYATFAPCASMRRH